VTSAWAAKPEEDIASFIAAKRNQVQQTARRLGASVPPDVTKLFEAAAAADWLSTSNWFRKVSARYKPDEQSSAPNRLPPEVWYPIQEVGGFCEMFSFADAKFIRLFADEIFKVVPSGSIYFGGTDPGRFIITGLSRSDQEGKPFLTVTQNQLVATNYLEYLRQMHGKDLKLPEPAQVKQDFDDYIKDVTARLQHDKDFPREPRQLKPGENVQTLEGRVQVSGEIAVMAINGLLARDLFQANPGREFWVEESYPIEWMYPHLIPVGPIFKLNREPLERLSNETITSDRRYWQQLTERLIGSKIQDESSVAEVCAVAKRLCQKTVPSDFKGDPRFLGDDAARKTFSKLRSADGAMYAWRMNHGISSLDKRHMAREAELAYKQAYVLCPYSPEAVGRYGSFLVEQDRLEEARDFARSAVDLSHSDPYPDQLEKYIEQVIEWKKRRS
jgi:hypothetical protein